MTNINISFANAFLLFLLLPAIGLLLFSFFRKQKKFRTTRNNVISLACGMTVFITAVLLLSGLCFTYDTAVSDNELLIVVDASYSNDYSMDDKNRYVQSVIDEADGAAKVGVITFAKDYVYAVELTDDLDSIYSNYVNAELPESGATDIASALTFAYEQLTDPMTGKILLLTDGIETDGDVLTTASRVAASGVKIDVACFDNVFGDNDVTAISVDMPNETLVVGNQIQISLVLQSNVETEIFIDFECNGIPVLSQTSVYIGTGSQTVLVPYTFTSTGLQEFAFTVSSYDDKVEQNNTIYSYTFLDVFEKILLIERDGESAALYDILENNYKVTVLNIGNAPNTITELLDYEQVVLMNISNADMPEGFIELMYDYVYNYGGGMLTVGGTVEEYGETVANVYNREDMEGTLYQDMLPVVAEDYTPPMAVIMLIDLSSSMGSDLVQLAKNGAVAALNALDDRDYVGVVTYGGSANLVLPLTPLSQRDYVENQIKAISLSGGYSYLSLGYQLASSTLAVADYVATKHVMVFFDEATLIVNTDLESQTKSDYEDKNISTSIIGMYESGSSYESVLESLTANAGGYYYSGLTDLDTLTEKMQEDIGLQAISELMEGEVNLSYGSSMSYFAGIDENSLPQLGGYFGARLRSDATAYIVGDYNQPIYAAWDYGAGSVGSFMCDMSTDWSSGFMSSAEGMALVEGIVMSQFANQSIINDTSGIDMLISQENLYASVYVRASLNDGESIVLTIKQPDNSGSEDYTMELDMASGSATINYEFENEGLYVITAEKISFSGSVASSKTVYQTFSYSSEYDTSGNMISNAAFAESIAVSGNGSLLTTSSQVFDDFVTVLTQIADPRLILAIVLIVTFLIDIVVRKFKFKWPHELYREYKAKRGE